jgi:hypothetical protein
LSSSAVHIVTRSRLHVRVSQGDLSKADEKSPHAKVEHPEAATVESSARISKQ